MNRFVISTMLIAAMCCAGCTIQPNATEFKPQETHIPAADFNAGDVKDTPILLIDGTYSKTEENKMEHPIALLTLENGKEIKLELYPEKAPETVANFIYLANERKLYDGLTFHRIFADFVVQGGDPAGDGSGGPGYTIKGEFKQNGFSQNDITHVDGVISMARLNFPYDSAGSQFFICVGDCSHLDGGYAGFGKVIEGMDYVYELSHVKANARSGFPDERQGIASIRVDTRGINYEKPATAK